MTATDPVRRIRAVRHASALSVVAALLAALAPSPVSASGPARQSARDAASRQASGQVLRQQAKVRWVSDGDTINVKVIGGKRARVRLLGIDTPEVFDTVECGGPEASAAMKEMLPEGSRVVLVSDPTQARKDVYGRLLRYVLFDGTDLNRRQVWLGNATVYVYHDNPFQRVRSYRKAQRQAKNAPRGIWASCTD